MMNKPPEFVRMTLECCGLSLNWSSQISPIWSIHVGLTLVLLELILVGLLLKNWVDQEITWKMAQKMTHHTHFITTIVHFDPFKVSNQVKEQLQSRLFVRTQS